ncbi:MAG: prephenate dehydratase [Acidobacteria bacterium]|nr:prephenate dehydratase [Acidobacteriota bacterium]
MSIAELRQKIDDIDDRILDLLNQRAGIVIEVGKIKTKAQQELYVPSRERTIFERLSSTNPGPFPNDSIRKVFREIISASLSLEHPIKVVFLGPRATFTHVAAMQQFGHSAMLVPAKSIPAIFEEVMCGRAKFGVVPIENSNEGAVTHTLDMFMESPLQIIAENYLEISHDLLSRTGRTQDIRSIVSHTQALAQCRRWLDEHFSEIPRIEVASTARAAQIAAEDESVAAVACGQATNLYGLQVIANKIEDHHNNFTRFLVIGEKMPDPSASDRTSLLFSFRDEAGILSKMLEPFRYRGLNLMKIESRPMKGSMWEYMFFLDVEGHVAQPKLAEAIGELKPLCSFLKVLGSYPRSR